MSDRVAVMRNGVFEQLGSPSEIYELPHTAYVANFVGSANVLTGVCTGGGDVMTASFPGGVGSALRRSWQGREGDSVTVAVRGENVQILSADDDRGIPARVTETRFAGGMLRISAAVEDSTEVVISRYGIDTELRPGDAIRLDWSPENAVIVLPDSEVVS